MWLSNFEICCPLNFIFRPSKVMWKERQSNKLKTRTSQCKTTTQCFFSDLIRRNEQLPARQWHKSRRTCLLGYACIAWLTTPDHLATQETYLQLLCSRNPWDWLLAIRQALVCKKLLQRLLADVHADDAVSQVGQPAHRREVPGLLRPTAQAVTVRAPQYVFAREMLAQAWF